MKKHWFIFTGLCILFSCTPVIILGPLSDSDKNKNNSPPGIANPASQYCQSNNGTLEIRRDALGNEVGYCLFPGQTECEEWAYFQGSCQPGQIPTERF